MVHRTVGIEEEALQRLRSLARRRGSDLIGNISVVIASSALQGAVSVAEFLLPTSSYGRDGDFNEYHNPSARRKQYKRCAFLTETRALETRVHSYRRKQRS